MEGAMRSGGLEHHALGRERPRAGLGERSNYRPGGDGWAAVQKQGEVPPAAAEAPEARLLPPDHKLPCPFL